MARPSAHLPLAAPRAATVAAAMMRAVTVPVLVLVLVLLHLVLERAAHDGTGNGADDAVAELVSADTTGSRAAKRTHQTALALCAGGGVGRSILLRVAVRALVLRPLLRELLLGRWRAVGRTLVLRVVLVVAVLLARVAVELLAVLEAAVRRRPVLAWLLLILVVAGLLAVLWPWRRSVALVLRRLRAVASVLLLRGVLLRVIGLLLWRVVAVALLAGVLVIGVGHAERDGRG